jgi:hypothetical protein
MTPIIFAEWFEDLNHATKNESGKMLLLFNNATSHSMTKVISNVTVGAWGSIVVKALHY